MGFSGVKLLTVGFSGVKLLTVGFSVSGCLLWALWCQAAYCGVQGVMLLTVGFRVSCFLLWGSGRGAWGFENVVIIHPWL